MEEEEIEKHVRLRRKRRRRRRRETFLFQFPFLTRSIICLIVRMARGAFVYVEEGKYSEFPPPARKSTHIFAF